MSLSSRDFIGPYRLVRTLRTSQTAEVLEAEHDTRGERVALKVLLPSKRRDREQLAMFKTEFRVGSEMRHPNTMRIFEFNVDREIPYLVMEFYTTQNLKQALQESPERILALSQTIIEQGAAGLEHLHSHGWVHRDIKPDNFLVDEAGKVKLIDYAIAVKTKSGLSKLLFGKTRVQGTRSYMSPEQIRGEALDPRADVYSFGCMIYELLAGKVPYTGGNSNDLLNKHLKALVPSLAGVSDNLMPDFCKLVVSMMAKSPADRPQSMTEFLKTFRGMRMFQTRPRLPRPAGEESDASSDASSADTE